LIESRDFIDPSIKLYYQAPRNKLEQIMQKGLTPQTLPDCGSRVRGKPAIFCLLQPQDAILDDLQDEHVLLEVHADPRFCQVADKSLWKKYRKLLKEETFEEASQVIKEYDQQALPLRIYRQGMLKEPEVLVRTSIPPEQITIKE